MSNPRNKNFAKSHTFPIVCVGASAGGLEALIAFLNFFPKNINMAFVLIQHLEPQHKSALSEILSRETSLNVREAQNNTQVEPAHVYVIPPNTRMTISRGKLRLTSRIKRVDGRYLPVDFFMISLAQAEREKAIGVILSGTGSDGTQGAQAIKAKGGTVLVQDEKTALYFGMPESVIKSGFADFVLAPRDIARKLVHMSAPGYSRPLTRAVKGPGEQDSLKRILVLLRDLTGADFIHYKEATVSRRIDRRMSFHNIVNHADYYSYLKKNPAEADALHKDILIPVTSFFRDPKIFSALRKKAAPFLMTKRTTENPLRLWVPACSTGEEVYSFAIFLYEYLEDRKIKPYIQVFGTDLSEVLIKKARVGQYGYDISQHVSADRLRRFFVKTDTGYKISKHIRDLCIFSKHDLTMGPPLSHMDIVSCRNLLIYLDTFLQNKALSMLHYALNPQGLLVLGTAESVTAVPGFFTAVDKKQKIYAKNVVPRRAPSAGAGEAAFTITKASPRKMKKRAMPRKKLDKPQVIVHPKKAGKPTVARPAERIMEYGDKDIVKLRKEFSRTVDSLNAISEEKDTFNEELKAANEEIQSSNEELQSMNEELETSKEELQSSNEELLTLNEELQNKNAELTHLNSDLSNVFSSTSIPIIIVDNGLRIKRFTPTARKVMNLIPTDVDRSIGDIKLNIDIANLEDLILGVIEDMAPKELEVTDKEGRWYSVRIRPYRTVDNKIDGAIIAMIDIDAIKRGKDEVQGALNYSQAIIETMREPLVVLDKNARVLSANKAFCDTFKVPMTDVKNKLLYDLGGRQWNDPGLRKLLEQVLPKKNYFNDFEVCFDFPQIGLKTMILNGRQIKLHGKESPLILLVIEDITRRKKAEDSLRQDKVALDIMIEKKTKESIGLQEKLTRARHLSAIGTLAATVAHELRNPLTDIALSIHRIKKSIKDREVIKTLEGINARIRESNQIVTNILSYSKTSITHFEPVRINDILRGTIDEESRDLSTAKKIAINEKMDPTKDMIIEADPVRLKEVFRNVLHNAIDAVHADTGIVEIETHVKRGTLSVLIRDNGEGIATKDLKNVAKPFFTTKAKGTGLGLAVSKQVILLHGGTITFSSVKGKGTMVVIMLPIKRLKNES